MRDTVLENYVQLMTLLLITFPPQDHAEPMCLRSIYYLIPLQGSQ